MYTSNGRSVRPCPNIRVTKWFAGPWNWWEGEGEIQHQSWTKSRPQHHPHLGRGRLRWCRPLLSPAGHCQLCSWSPWTEFQLGSASCKPSRYPGLAKVPGQQQRPPVQGAALGPRVTSHPQTPGPEAKDSAARGCPMMHGRIRLMSGRALRACTPCTTALDSPVARLGKALF